MTLQDKSSFKRLAFWGPAVVFAIGITWNVDKILEGYLPKDEELVIKHSIDYEKRYRSYQNLPKPTITDLKTTIDLFPLENSYIVEGKYTLENKTKSAINSFLINFADGFEIKKAILLYKNEKIVLKEQIKTINLQASLLPGDKMNFEFEFSYQWIPVNGHQSFNA